MPRKIKLINLFLFGLLSFCAFAQEGNNRGNGFLELEYLVGKVIPNGQVDNFPELRPQQAISLTYGGHRLDTNSWAKYYGFPTTGITAVYSNIGDNQIFGHQFSVLPFVSFSVFKHYQFRLSSGVAYFNRFHDPVENPRNRSVGSRITWDIKAFAYRNLISSDKFNLRLGVGFSHESNGHTNIPNLGLNTVFVGLSGQFYKNTQPETPARRIKDKTSSPKSHFLTLWQGYGFHEQDPSEGPKTNRSKPVYSTSLAYGFIVNRHIKLRTGLLYRFYEQYNTHLQETIAFDLNENRFLSSSNLVLFVGGELLMSHFGLDLQLGVNLHKPFFNSFNPNNDIGTVLQKVVSSRAGANIYLKNTNNLPKHNLFIGAHINANMAKADFTGFSLGYVYSLSQ